MAMSRKDYVAIGNAIRNSFDVCSAMTWNNPEVIKNVVARQIAGVFEQDNPRFDTNRFLRFVETGKDVR